MNLANIEANARIQVEVNYIETVSVSDNIYKLILPLTYIPRYTNTSVPEVEKDLLTRSQLNEIRGEEIDSHKFDLNLLLVSDLPIEELSSPSHNISYTPVTEGYQINLTRRALMDRDFEVHWMWQVPFKPVSSVYTETVNDSVYMLGLINPSSSSHRKTVNTVQQQYLPRDLMIVVDTSGSMDGAPIRTAKNALRSAINGLNSGDYFNLVRFSTWMDSLFSVSQPVNAETLRQARRYIDSLDANGGTEMLNAVEFALNAKTKAARSNPDILRQIVFITDGAIGYERDVTQRVQKHLGDSRLFTVGIGQAPNRDFMKKLAAAGRGTHTFIRDVSAVESKIDKLFRSIERPVMRDIEISWLGEPADLANNRLRDLHDGEPLLFAAKLHPKTRGFVVRGTLADQLWQETVYFEHQTLTPTPNGENTIEPFDQSGISTVWARHRISNLLEQYHSQPAVPSAKKSVQLSMTGLKSELWSDVDKTSRQAIKERITALGITHRLLTPFTSFVAVDNAQRINRPANTPTAEIPNLVPAGNYQMIPMPRTATPIELFKLISVISFLIALAAGLCLLHLEKHSINAFNAKAAGA